MCILRRTVKTNGTESTRLSSTGQRQPSVTVEMSNYDVERESNLKRINGDIMQKTPGEPNSNSKHTTHQTWLFKALRPNTMYEFSVKYIRLELSSF